LIYKIRYTASAREDLLRLYAFLLDQDLQAAEYALATIEKSIELLQAFPFTCRKAMTNNPFIRELVISFGANGYVALFEIDDDTTVTILAVRHQREDDYR